MNFMLLKKIVGIRRGLMFSGTYILLFDFKYNFRFASCTRKLTSNRISCHIMVLNRKIIAQSHRYEPV